MMKQILRFALRLIGLFSLRQQASLSVQRGPSGEAHGAREETSNRYRAVVDALPAYPDPVLFSDGDLHRVEMVGQQIKHLSERLASLRAIAQAAMDDASSLSRAIAEERSLYEVAAPIRVVRAQNTDSIITDFLFDVRPEQGELDGELFDINRNKDLAPVALVARNQHLSTEIAWSKG